MHDFQLQMQNKALGKGEKTGCAVIKNCKNVLP